MEDGVTIAICLREAGKRNIQAATRAFQDIRYERVKAVQKTGETTRDVSLRLRIVDLFYGKFADTVYSDVA